MILRQKIFFSGFRSKHLFITTCVENYCTRPLKVDFNLKGGRNSIVKIWKTFLNAMQTKFRPKIPYRYREIIKTEQISLSYDVNDLLEVKIRLNSHRFGQT